MSKAISINPATGKKIAEFDRHTENEISVIITQAATAYQEWKLTTFEHRANLLRQLAQVFLKNKQEYAQLMTNEMGKMINQAEAEIEKCVLVCNFYAEHGEAFMTDEIVETEAHKSYISYQSMGAVLAVMPWNFPFYQVIRFIAPALMSGNVGVLKHASNVQGCAFAIEEAFAQAGFPKGAFANMNVSSDQVKSIIEHPSIIGCTLTGSESAGRAVATIAGKSLKKTVMELGGTDAYIFLEDIDMDKAIALALRGRLRNAGQTCIAAKRLIVLEEVYDAFLERLTEAMRVVQMGDPYDLSNALGPMARQDLRDELHEQVQKSIAQGADLIVGGKLPDREGAFYPPTLLAGVLPGMEAFDHELFGPVAAVIRAKDEAHAIELANRSDFGLGAGVITSNVKRGEKIALQLEAGNCFVNKLVASDPRMPFGGIKNSGYGRELSKYGMREFVNVKTVWVD